MVIECLRFIKQIVDVNKITSIPTTTKNYLPKHLPILSKPGLILLPNSTLPIVVTQSFILDLIFYALKKKTFYWSSPT